MPHIPAKDCSLYYTRQGQGEPLVLISGYLCDHVYWRAVVANLSKSYQVISFDNRGVGQSTVGAGIVSIQQMAEDTLQLLDQLNLDKVTLVGHSMGGMIAHQLALLAPKRIKHLILYCSRPHITAQSAFTMKTFLNLHHNSTEPVLNTRLILPWVMSERFFDNEARVEQLLELTAQNLYPMTPEIQEQHYHALCKHDLRTELANISVPTTLLMGSADLLVPPALSHWMAQQIPMARYHLIEGAPHSWHLEQPDAFNQSLQAILKEVP